MKAIALLLALLAAAKLGYHEYLFRTGTRDAIVAAYREHAVQACQHDAKSLNVALAPQAWANPDRMRVMIGKSTLEVHVWQIQHPMWNARYRNPYLSLTVGAHTGSGAGAIACEYDIVNASASVSRL